MAFQTNTEPRYVDKEGAEWLASVPNLTPQCNRAWSGRALLGTSLTFLGRPAVGRRVQHICSIVSPTAPLRHDCARLLPRKLQRKTACQFYMEYRLTSNVTRLDMETPLSCPTIPHIGAYLNTTLPRLQTPSFMFSSSTCMCSSSQQWVNCLGAQQILWKYR